MARIDNLIDVLADQRVPMAAMKPEQPVMLDKGGGDNQPLNDRTISTKQIELLLSEILSSGQKEDLRSSGRLEFDYDGAAEPVTITALRRSGKLSVYFSLASDDTFDGNRETDAGETSSETTDGDDDESNVATAGDLAGMAAADESEEPDEEPDEGSDADATETDSGGAEEADVDKLEMSFEDDSHESSFVDSSARPTSAEAERGTTADEPDERTIPMKEPGASAEIDQYLRIMAEKNCSDLHLTSGNPPLYRQDGEIVHLGEMDSLSPGEVEELLLPIIPDKNYEEFLEIRDTDFSYAIDGVGRFRTNIFMDRKGPGGVFRLIPDELMTAEDLGLSDPILDLCSLNKGFVLVTGPTGSGKSTTLAALIDYINRKRTSHIITLEDPIEFVHDNKNCLINQREVGVHTMGFKNAMRAALREDPDIVLVGELRDLETIELALETAETGHLVFGTLHTNTAPSTVDRIIDQFPSDRQAQIRTMLSESLRAVIAQTLCKRIDGGRVSAMEVLMINNAVSNLIREGKAYQIPNVMETSKGEGMVKLNDALMQHVDNDVIAPDEAYFNAVDKDEMRSRLERAGYRVQFD